MSKLKNLGDKELAAITASTVIFLGVVSHWVIEIVSTVELLELAYGSFNLFNNPLVF
ncbi:MAG: hypothetical protein ACI95C_000044 [Pseudohongiellaceae bacterium]|jgi:hypothetical protein